MRTKAKGRGYFLGTHKGAEVEIEREKDGRFYIMVTYSDGGCLYDGWAPEGVRTMPQAKREALRGSCLDRPSPPPAAEAEAGSKGGAG